MTAASGVGRSSCTTTSEPRIKALCPRIIHFPEHHALGGGGYTFRRYYGLGAVPGTVVEEGSSGKSPAAAIAVLII